MIARIADTETTGSEKEQERPEIIELAHAEVQFEGFMLKEIHCERYKPVRNKISFGAMATHHILPEDLQHCSYSSAAVCIPADTEYLIGHNVDFDWRMLGSPDVKRICTLAMARSRWEDGSHSLGACLYRVLSPALAKERLRNAHSAAGDVFNCYTVLQHLLGTVTVPLTSWDAIWHHSEECRLPRKWTFGKYEGRVIGQENGGFPDFGYHGWCLRQPDMDQYLKKRLLQIREGG